MKRFSIIIPHYNIPELLVRALKSVPSREDVQIIIVDDCTPNFDTILSVFPDLRRPDIEFYKTPKGGSAGRARNIGIKHAMGKWLIFLDADDLLSERAFQIMDGHYNDDVDVIYFKSKVVMSNDLSKVSCRYDSNKMINYALKTGDDVSIRFFTPEPWGKMIRTSIVKDNNLKYSETRYCNDAYFATLLGLAANKVSICDEIFYILTEREGSLASSQFGKKKPSKQEITERYIEPYRCFKLMQKHGINEFANVFDYVDRRGSKFFYQDQRKFWIIFFALTKYSLFDAMALLIVALGRPFSKIYRIISGRQSSYKKDRFSIE